jgi:parallel beta-helix repeat protein
MISRVLMMKSYPYGIILFIIIYSIHANAITYYLSDKGNDYNRGTSKDHPWCSLKKLNTVLNSIKAGDSILFERGNSFEGNLYINLKGQTNNEIYFGTYGVGFQPVFDGAKAITNWKVFNKNIWVSECAFCESEPKNLFINNVVQPLGRYPDHGYRSFTCEPNSQKCITDKSLNFSDNYWNNAEIVVKSSRWTIDNISVQQFKNNTFLLSQLPTYPLSDGFGYFIQKHLSTLSKTGEWYYDKDTKQVYLYLNQNTSPANLNITVSIEEAGLIIERSKHITIENLSIRYYQKVGSKIKESDFITFQNNEVGYSGVNGLEIISCIKPNVRNNRITDSNNNGVEWYNNKDGLFINNSIRRTGLFPGYGDSGNRTYNGLNIWADDPTKSRNLFQYNTIDSVGYIGIDFRTGYTTIRNNVISHFCLTKDDGAGIYTWGNTNGNNHIEKNIVLHGIGSGSGTTNPDQLYAFGIYIDDRSSDISVKENSIAHCSNAGIFIHNARKIKLLGNTLFKNSTSKFNSEKAQLIIKLDSIVPLQEQINLDHDVIMNTFVSNDEMTYCIYFSANKKEDLDQPGTFVQNRYWSIYPNQVVARFYNQREVCTAPEEFKLGEWQNITGLDKGSVFKKLLSQNNNDVINENLIANSGMTDMGGWIIWPEQINLLLDKVTGMDGPLLKVKIPAHQSQALLYHAGFALNKKLLYRLSFTAKSIKKSGLEFVPLTADYPWEALDNYACFAMDTVYKSYSYFFKPDKDSRSARVNFKSNTTYWIDNVTLHTVQENRNRKDDMKMIYNATPSIQKIRIGEGYTDLYQKQLTPDISLLPYHSLIITTENR